MLGMDGMAAAKEIRAFDSEAKLVFLTSFSEYAYQSYRVRAYDYLLKPVQKETLTELLDRMRAEEAEAEACIDIQNGRSVFRIPCARLACLEVNQKKLFFYLTDGQVRTIPGLHRAATTGRRSTSAGPRARSMRWFRPATASMRL